MVKKAKVLNGMIKVDDRYYTLEGEHGDTALKAYNNNLVFIKNNSVYEHPDIGGHLIGTLKETTDKNLLKHAKYYMNGGMR